MYNYLIILRFSHQKKSIERYNVVKRKIILWRFDILDLFLNPLDPDPEDPWIRNRKHCKNDLNKLVLECPIATVAEYAYQVILNQ